MDLTGEVRKIDELGRVVIPKGIRTDMDFKKKRFCRIFDWSRYDCAAKVLSSLCSLWEEGKRWKQ